MAVNNTLNPCSYKTACKRCNKVSKEDRPGLCEALECIYYTPCSKCGLNVNKVDPSLGHCGDKNCEYLKSINDDSDIISELITDLDIEDEDDAGDISDTRGMPISLPGTPPDDLTNEEKIYFQRRWDEYEGYYRNPVAYVICHNMILEEIRLAYVTTSILRSRGERLSDLENQKTAIYTNLKKLKDQLPEKESEKLSDDEKSIGVLYEKYCEERDFIRTGKATRVLTQDAIALAPELVIKIDPYELLINCGFSIEDSKKAAEKVISNEDVKLSGLDLLTFLGYKLKEEYAMPTDSTLNLEDFLDE